ncbi:hypothetical protein AYL99_08694 [Fonsecaea erecta]|uniref:Involucrin repeat protein n=1 Tax=Fonsecaea erecta TaxID=1367422 RepID=A0A178ZA91_9EURO|nr:hypothetical protein AYL99_08694 [Fonsecaea erecta]OAP56582.1 hypothetical protein AYL99_08694 [Fonsecaea erecta]
MRKSSSGRHRTGSEASARSERPRNEDQDYPKGRSTADAMTTSSRRKPSRHSKYDETDATYATSITDEPSQISDRYRNDLREDPEPSDTRKRSSKNDKRTKYEKSRGGKEDNDSWKPRKDDSARDSRRSSKSNSKESARPYRSNSASLPQNQFPGEFPSTYSQPYRPPGLAAEYYGDSGESVAFQPGVRPNAPNIVTSAEQAHLLEPTVEAKPPPEPSSMGQVGAAASYFGNNDYDDDVGSQMTPSKPPQKLNLGSDKPPRHSYYGVSPRTSPRPQGNPPPAFGLAPGRTGSFPASGTAAIGEAAEYYAGGGGGGSSTNAYQTPNRPPPGAQTASSPYSAPAGIGGSHQYSSAALYGGAAALAGAAAGAYVSGHSHNPASLTQHQNSTSMAGLAHGYPLSHGTQTHHAHRHKHQGLFGRFIDWWRDPEAVARFEEYTESIGVCKYCFDPMSSPADAPRRHDYRRRRPSPGSRHGSTTRVDKMYRQSSDENLRKHPSAKKKMVVGGLAGYGVAKLGEAIVKQKHDSDDTYSVKSGHPANPNRVSFQEEQQFRRYDDAGFGRSHSHHSAARSKTSSTQRGHPARRSSSSSSSRSSQVISRGTALSTGLGAAGLAIGAAALDAGTRRRSKSRSRSPSSRKKYFSKRVSPMHSYVDLSTTNEGSGGLMSFFTSPSANSRKGKKPKGLFSFSNASSSSSDADLRFGEGTVRRKISKKRLRERQGKKHRNNSVAAMEDLVITGTALAGEANRREQKGRQKYDADRHTGPDGKHANGRRISMADHETSGGRDDEWYDTDGGGDSESSVDMAMAYGGGFSTSQRREHLPQNGRPLGSGYNSREQDQRQYQNSLEQANIGHAPYFPISSVKTAALAGAGGALGGWMASNALSKESNPPPTYSSPDSMRKLEPRPMSDSPSKASPQTTRVSSMPMALYQPQPIVPVTPFIDNNLSGGTQFEGRMPWTGQRASSYVERDSFPADLPSQASRNSVNFNLTNEQLENEERAKCRDKRRRDSFGDNDQRKPVDATLSMDPIQNSAEPLRDQTALKPKRSSDAGESSFDADRRVAEIDRELERLYQEHEKAEARKKGSDLKKAVESAVIGEAAAVAVGSMVNRDNKRRSHEEGTPTRKSNLKKMREKDASSSSETQQERNAGMVAHGVRSTPSPVQHDDYGAFFVPTEIKEHLKEHNDKAEHRDDFGATVVEIIPGAPKPSSSHPFDPFTYRQFGLGMDDDPLLHPWPVPILGLIEPTPPGSQVHSVAGDATPDIEPRSKGTLEDIGEPLERKESKVTWGEHDTFVYEVVTPEYERSDYGPESQFQGQNTADIPSLDAVTEAPASITEETQQRPSVGRAWTLDENTAEQLEKEMSVIDDRPQIGRAWTINDLEAEEIAQKLPEDKPKEDSVGLVYHDLDHGSDSQDTMSTSINGLLEDRPGDAFPIETTESNRQKAVYQSPFAETVSDLGAARGNSSTVEPETKPRIVLALEDGGEQDKRELCENENISEDARPSTKGRRRRERSSSSVDASLPSPAQQIPSEVLEDASPRDPSHKPHIDRSLANKSGALDSSALGLGVGTSILLAADPLTKNNGQYVDAGSTSGSHCQSSRPEGLTVSSDPRSQGQHSGSKGEHHSDPEEWERLREKPKKSKTGAKSDAGEKTSRKSKNRRTAENADFEPLRRSRTDDDLYDNERPRRSSRYSNGDFGEEPTVARSGKDEKRTSRTSHHKDSDGYHEGDDRPVTSSTPDSRTQESGGFFSNLFASNKSDISTSSKKSSKSSKSDSRADRERRDAKETRKKRKSKDKSEWDDVATAVSEPSTRSQRSPDRQTVRHDPKETSNDQTVDDGFVSAEETAGTPTKDSADQESFLGSRPEMPQPMVTDMPMGTDGVSGPRSERETSSPPDNTSSVYLGASVRPTNDNHVAVPLTALTEVDHSGTLPNEPAPDVVEEGSSAPFAQPAASRRLSAIRTADIPSSPMMASSPTAVPLHFRRPPISPTNPRFSMSSPVIAPSSPLTTPRTRQGRPKSTEFRSSKEFRPLYLVERQNYARTAATDPSEEYPSLPSSKTSSAHPSLEDLRAEAHLQDQAESFTPSRISTEVFRERGRRHSYSYWNDGEGRRESPDYLDSRSATPVPGEAQRARDQEKKPKPKYEFHSPSELLQDPTLLHDAGSVDEQFVPHSPLPSVAGTDADQDYMSARSRSLSPTGTLSRSRSRRSPSLPRSASAAWQDEIGTTAAGALVGSALALAARQALKHSQEDLPAEEVETPRKPQSFAEGFKGAMLASGPDGENVAGAGSETTTQQPNQNEPVHATIDLDRDTESQVPSEATFGGDAWRDVFAEIHKRRLDPDMIADASTAVNTEVPEIDSFQKPAANELVSPSHLDEVAQVRSVDGRPSDPDEVTGAGIASPEEAERLNETSGESPEDGFLASSSVSEPFHPMPGLEKQAETVKDSREGFDVHMESVEKATGPSHEPKKSREAGDKNDEDARLTSDDASSLVSQVNGEQSDAEIQSTEPKAVFASDVLGIEARTSGIEDCFEAATDVPPTAVESETPIQLEAAPSIDIDKQNIGVGDAALDRSLTEDESSNVAQSSRDPLEEAFKQAMEARGLTTGATIEAAYQAFQPEIPDIGGTQLSTIREEGELPSPSTERVSVPTDGERLAGRSKKEKRKQKKAKKTSIMDNLVEPESLPTEGDNTQQIAMAERQEVETARPILPGEVTKEPTPTGDGPNPFGDDFETNPSEPEVPPGDVNAHSTIAVDPSVRSGIMGLSSSPEVDSSVSTLKKTRKGKNGKKKQFQPYSGDDADMSSYQNQPGEPAPAVESAVEKQRSATGASNEPEPPTLEGPDGSEMAVDSTVNVQQEAEHVPETSLKSGKKKKSKKKKSVPVPIQETSEQMSEESSTATQLPHEPQPSIDPAAHVSGSAREPTFTNEMVQEPVAVDVPQAAPESFAEQANDVLSADASKDPLVPVPAPEVIGHSLRPETIQLDAPLQNDRSDEDQTLDTHAAVDSFRTETPPAYQQLPADNTHTSVEGLEAATPLLAIRGATVPVIAVAPTDETKPEMGIVDTSPESTLEVAGAPYEEASKDPELGFKGTPTAGENEPINDEQAEAAPTPSTIAERDHIEEPPTASAHDESSINVQTPTDQIPAGEPTHEDEGFWASGTERSRKDKKKKRISVSGDAPNTKSVREAPLSDETVTKPVFSVAEEDKDTEMPTAPGSSEALPVGDPRLVQDEPRQDEDMYLITTKKPRKDKKKKRASAVEGTEVFSSVQEGEVADSIMNSGVPDEGSMAEAPTELNSKKKSKKSKAQKERQYVSDNVSGSVDDVEIENDEQVQTILPTTPTDRVGSADTDPHLGGRTEHARDLRPGEAEDSVGTTAENLNTGVVQQQQQQQQQSITALPPADVENDDAAPELADFGVENHTDPRASLDVTKEGSPVTGSSLDNLPDMTIQSVKAMEAEARVNDASGDDTAAIETSINDTTQKAMPTESRGSENPPSETAAPISPVVTNAEIPARSAANPAEGSGAERDVEVAPEPFFKAVTESTSEATVAHHFEHSSKPANEPAAVFTPQTAAEPTPEAASEEGIETSFETPAESTRVTVNEGNIGSPAEKIIDTLAEPADKVGVMTGSEATVEPASPRKISAVPSESEAVLEEDSSFPPKQSKKKRKKEKDKRQSNLITETTQFRSLPSETQTVTDGPDADEDEKKKKRQATQVPDALHSETITHSADKSNIETEIRPSIETIADESGPTSEPTIESAFEVHEPERDALTIEENSSNIRQELASIPTKSKKDKKKKKRQSDIESAATGPAFETTKEEASQSTTDNVTGPFTNDDTQRPDRVEDLSRENDVLTPGHQAEDWRAPSGKKKNRKKGQKFKLDDASWYQDNEQIGPHEDPYLDSKIENGVREPDVNVSEKEPMFEPITQQESASAEANDVIARTLTPEESTSAQLKGRGHQPRAADIAEESSKVQTVSEQDNADGEKPPKEELVPMEPVHEEAELLNVRDMWAQSLSGTPGEDLATAGIVDVASLGQVSEQPDLSRKKLKKGKKKARQSGAGELEEQEAFQTLMAEDDSSLTPMEAVLPIAENDWPTSTKSKSKNGKRKHQRLDLDDSFAEPAPSTPEVESAKVEGLDEATTQPVPAVSEAIPDQEPRIEGSGVAKKGGKKKKKRQSTFADVEEFPLSMEALASPIPVSKSKQSEEKSSFSTVEGDVAGTPSTGHMSEEHRFDPAAANTDPQPIGDALRQYEMSMDATPVQKRTIMKSQDPKETTAEEVPLVTFANIEAGDSPKLRPSIHTVSDVPTTTLPDESTADLAPAVPHSLAASHDGEVPIVTEAANETPTTMDTDSVHVEESSISEATLPLESKQGHITEERLSETLIAVPAAQSQIEQLAAPDAAKLENLQFHAELPPEFPVASPVGGVDEMSTPEVPSPVVEVNKSVEYITEQGAMSSRPKEKSKKQRQSTYEDPVSEPQQSGNTGPEVEAEAAETQPAVTNTPERLSTAAPTNDTAAEEEISSRSKRAKKDKKKKLKTLLVEDVENGSQLTIPKDLGAVEEPIASESQLETKTVANSVDAAAPEINPERNVAEEAAGGWDARHLASIEPVEEVSRGLVSEIPEVMHVSPSATDQMAVPGETSVNPGFKSDALERTTETMGEYTPPAEEDDTVWSGFPKTKKSQKEKRKSKRKSAFEEGMETGDVNGLKEEIEMDTQRDDVPPTPIETSTPVDVQPDSKWGFSSKRAKKKGKKSKALTATDDFGTSGTATPNSNDEFASAMQTPIQRTASPELMDYVKAEQTSVTAPETDNSDDFASAPSKKKSEKDKKRKSLLAWTGNEDQTAEDASGTSTLAPLAVPEKPRNGEISEKESIAIGLEKENAESKLETPFLLSDSQVMKTGADLDLAASAAQRESLQSEDYTDIPADPRKSAIPSVKQEALLGQHTLDNLHDPASNPDQRAASSTKSQFRGDRHEAGGDPAQRVINIGDELLQEATNISALISDPSEAKSANDQVVPPLYVPGDYHQQDEHVGSVAAEYRVPEVTDHQHGVFETDDITPEERSTAVKSIDENDMNPGTTRAFEDAENRRGLDEMDFSTSRDTLKRKKSKKDKKDKKAKKKSGISDEAGFIQLPMELDQTEIREPATVEILHNEGMEIPEPREQLPENAEELSDVSTTTRERRKRRRSPPAWAREEPEDLPRDRALTPPPEHDDIMDTALGVAAGLGFGSSETESTREPARKVPSPARQASAGWSFAKLDPVTKLADAETNRDSGVQFESPTLSSELFVYHRDSGYVQSPTVQHGEFSTTKDSNTDINLRPPRPQSPTSSTEDVSKAMTSKQHVHHPASLETPRRKPSPVESTSKDRSSVLFHSSPAMPSPLKTDIRSRSPQAMSSPLRRSPSIHGHHHSREELRQQKAKISPHHEDSDQLASNLIDRAAAAPVNRSAFDSHSHTNTNRPYSPGKTTLNAINEDTHAPTSQPHPFSDPPASLTPRHSAENDNLAAAGLVAGAGAAASKSRTSSLRNLRSASISPYDPANFASGSSQGPINAQITGKTAAREREMAEVYDGYGSYPGSPRSPTRPPSIRQRQSMQQIRDLEAKLDQLASENRSLAEAKIVTEQQLEQAHFERNRTENDTVTFNAQIQERDAEIARLKQEVASLIATHESLKKEHEQSLASLQENYDEAQSQWQDSLQELETLRSRHNELSTGMESLVRHEIDTALSEKNAEIQRLRGDLEAAREKIRDLQSQILSRGADDVVVFHDEDYFDQACQKLCQQVQGWVLRFSKFSDLKLCRTTSEVRDEKIVDRFDNAILDGSDVDVYLADRVKRRDVFMSVVMTMIWEYVFIRYLFGMDRDQRQKLKQLEKNLGEVGPQSAVHQWRALTLTLLSKRESFKAQRESDTEAVAIEIFSTLSRFLPPPQNLEEQIVGSLRNVMRTAVELSIEMRTQRAEYIMLPPLQPEYDTNGDLVRKVYFNASLMNERSGETTSNEELERERAVVRMVLFPLVVKKGDDNGVGDEEIVVCPAQVLIARPDRGKRVKSSTRHASGGSDAKSLRAVSTHSLAMSGIEGNENMF